MFQTRIRAIPNDRITPAMTKVREESHLDGEGVAQEVGEAGDGGEHGALHQPQRLLEHHLPLFRARILKPSQSPIPFLRVPLPTLLSPANRNPRTNCRGSKWRESGRGGGGGGDGEVRV